MKNRGDRDRNTQNRFILPPAYPFCGQELLEDLRTRLAKQHGHALGFLELGRLMGQATSTAHFWFSAYRHPHLLGFMALLERLSLQERAAFIAAHCRVFPLLSDPSLVGQTVKVRSLLDLPAGLTVITGYSNWARTLVLTGLGHSWRRLHRKEGGPAGVDIQRPIGFVPVETLHYVDERLDPDRVRELALSIWPKLATSRTHLLLGNRLWSSVPDLRKELLRAAKFRHVVLAEPRLSDFTSGAEKLPESTNLVSLSQAAGNAIRLTCGLVNSRKGH